MINESEEKRVIVGKQGDYTIVQCTRSEIPVIQSFACHVFDSQETPSENPSLQEWFDRYDCRNGLILVACLSSETDINCLDCFEELTLCAFMFAYESVSVLSSDKVCMHVWLCATDVPHRSNGITRKLFSLVSEEATRNRHLDTLAVNTYPAYFPHMYSLLSHEKSGFNCILERDRSNDRGIGNNEPAIQACFEKALPT